MTMSFTEGRTAPTPPRAMPATEEPYVPVYARRAPKKGATPWLLVAPVALAAVAVVSWVVLAGGEEAPAEAETIAAAQPLSDPLLAAPTTEPLSAQAPLAPVPPAPAQAVVEAQPAPVRRAAPARRAAPVERAAPTPAPAATVVAEEAAAPTGPQPYVAEPAVETPAAATPPAPAIVTEPIG